MTISDIRDQLREELNEQKRLREEDHKLIAVQHQLIESQKADKEALKAISEVLLVFKKKLDWTLWALINVTVLLILILVV